MRILLALHHQLDPNKGAAGATLGLGSALEAAGCKVDYFGYDQAFPRTSADGPRHALLFPWRLAAFLQRHAHSFDIIDTSTGDNWAWAQLGRPGARRRHALVTRSHGLEHTADLRLRQQACRGQVRLSWKYPLYHGGFRLWEVKQSIRFADHVIVLNQIDRRFVARKLAVSSDRVSALPNGIGPHFTNLPIPEPSSSPMLRLAFLGCWIHRKGADVVSRAVHSLASAGIAVEISLFGVMTPEERVLECFDVPVRKHIRVVPHFHNTELPQLLVGHDALLFPSVSEGFSLALVEAMACGLAPIATPVGGAPSVISSGSNGILIPVGDDVALTQAIAGLAADRDTLLQMRRNAQVTARAYQWETIAARTLQAYEGILNQPGHSVQ